jgi:hypothetical protein
MSKWGVTQVMSQGDSLGEVFVEIQSPSYSAGDLGDFKGMGQASHIVISEWSDKHLCLMFETPESLGMNNAVAITLEGSTNWARLLGSDSSP